MQIAIFVMSPFNSFATVDLSGYTSFVAQASAYITPINAVISLSNLAIAFGILISVDVGIFTYKGIMWLIKRLPTQS